MSETLSKEGIVALLVGDETVDEQCLGPVRWESGRLEQLWQRRHYRGQFSAQVEWAEEIWKAVPGFQPHLL